MNSGSCGQMTTLCAIVNLELLESNFGHVISMKTCFFVFQFFEMQTYIYQFCIS